ncbi:MAG: sulfatase-like hydrolase/transferase [Candidatus Limnocylindrales bacterium]
MVAWAWHYGRTEPDLGCMALGHPTPAHTGGLHIHSHSHRLIRILAVALTAASLAIPAAQRSTLAAEPLAGSPPNIVFILVDDLGAIDDRVLDRLPEIKDTFVDHGTRFSDFYGETALCCPGRAGFLTGLHTHHHNVIRNDARLLDPSMTVATQLHSVGYRTILVGKYLNKYDLVAPAEPPGWDTFQALVPGDTSYAGYYEYDLWIDGAATPKHFGTSPQAYSTDVIANRTLNALRAAPLGQPIFAWVAPFAVHGPTIPAPRHRSDPRCSSIPLWAPASYNETDVSDKPAYVQAEPLSNEAGFSLGRTCRTMLAIDDMVGDIKAELAASGRLDDTMFILTSDNGMNLGAHRLPAKSAPYATQIPFFVSWPRVLHRGPRRVEEMLSNIDVAPTLCEFAGCTMGPYPGGQPSPDGISFARILLEDVQTLGRDAILQSSPAKNVKLSMPSWFGLRTTPQSVYASTRCAAAETGGCLWHYARYSDKARELYDDSNGPCWLWNDGQTGDPCELDNLMLDPAYAELAGLLDARLDALLLEPDVTSP